MGRPIWSFKSGRPSVAAAPAHRRFRSPGRRDERRDHLSEIPRDLVASRSGAGYARRARGVHAYAKPLDVLAQQVVAWPDDTGTSTTCFARSGARRRTRPQRADVRGCSTCCRATRPMKSRAAAAHHVDACTGTNAGREGARFASANRGHIPDRGLYGVFSRVPIGRSASGARRGDGLRDHVGETFTLGART